MKFLAIRAVVAWGMVLAGATPVLAENWPGFRGPTGQGLSTEKALPTRWSESQNVAWKTEIPGQSWSSPIVFGDRVFLTTATDNGVSGRILCLDRKSGQILWNKEVLQQPLKRKENRNTYATPTPVTDGQRVYAVFNDGSIVAVDYEGKTLWVNREVKFYSQHGLGASPILFEDLLIMPFDSSSEGPDRQVGWKKPWQNAVILAVDKKTGQTQWRGQRGLSRIAHVTPNIMRFNGQPLLVSGAGDVVQGHDPKTGQLLWSVYSRGEGVVPSIVLGEELIYSASGFEKPTIRAIRPGGSGDVTKTHIAWEQASNVPTLSSFVLANGLLFTVKENGIAQCLKADSGKVVWQERLEGTYGASPIVADGKVYFLADDGQTTIVEAGEQFKVIARNKLEEKCQASMAASQGQFFIRTDKNLYCIGAGR